MSRSYLLFVVLVALLLFLMFPDINLYSYFAILIFISQIYLLLISIGSLIPIRNTFGVLLATQMLFGPFLTYNWLPSINSTYMIMKVDQNTYFGYVIPAVLCFLYGLNLRLDHKSKKHRGEVIDFIGIQKFGALNKSIPLIFIAIGFVSSLMVSFFSSYLAFLFVLLGGLKFIGLFLIIIGNVKLKLFPLILILFSIFSSSFSSGMFHDLLIWLIFIGAVLSVKYRPTFILKSIGIIVFIFMAIIIQQLKGSYRENLWVQKQEGNIETYFKVLKDQSSSNNIFSLDNIAPSIIRINQGYIITNIMITVPSKIPFEWGNEMQEILEAAILPRFLAPNKLTAGNQELFMKYSGIELNKTTSMGLSSIGDAYINFGVVGGCIFMFFLGLLYNQVLISFQYFSKTFPVLILFTPLIFYYPIRPDCELQTILGHLVKSCFLVFVIFRIYSQRFKLRN